MKSKHPVLSGPYVRKNSRAYLTVAVAGIGIAVAGGIVTVRLGLPEVGAPGFFAILIMSLMATLRREQMLENATIMERLNAVGRFTGIDGPQNNTPDGIRRPADGPPKPSI